MASHTPVNFNIGCASLDLQQKQSVEDTSSVHHHTTSSATRSLWKAPSFYAQLDDHIDEYIKHLSSENLASRPELLQARKEQEILDWHMVHQEGRNVKESRRQNQHQRTSSTSNNNTNIKRSLTYLPPHDKEEESRRLQEDQSLSKVHPIQHAPQSTMQQSRSKIHANAEKQGDNGYLRKLWAKVKRSSPSTPSSASEPTQEVHSHNTSSSIAMEEKTSFTSRGARKRKGLGFIGAPTGINSDHDVLSAQSPYYLSPRSTTTLASSHQNQSEIGPSAYPSTVSLARSSSDTAVESHTSGPSACRSIRSEPLPVVPLTSKSSQKKNPHHNSYTTTSNRCRSNGNILEKENARALLGQIPSAPQSSHTTSSCTEGSPSRSLPSTTSFTSLQSTHSKDCTEPRIFSRTDVVPRSRTVSCTTQLTPKTKPSPRKLAIIVVGDGAVGKSALTLRFLRNQFHDEYDPTIEDSYCRHIEVDGQEYTLDITDTAGQVEYRKHWNDSFQSCGDGFVCVYSIASHDSFRELAGYRDQIWNSKQSRHVPMMMVGNKFDLEAKGERQVATDAGARFAEQSNSLFLEASAKTGRNIDEMFIELVREIERTRKLREDSGLFNKDDAYIPEKSVPVPACIQGYSTNATPPMVRMLDIGGEDVKKGHCGCAIM